MSTRRILLAAVLAVGMTTTLASAQLINETFTYPNGNLVGQGVPAWEAHSAAGSSPVQVSSNTAVLNQGSGSREDVNKPMGAVLGSGQKIYGSFDFSNTGGSGDVYFAHFKDSGTINFASRVWITAPTQGGNYTIGITSTSGTASNVVDWTAFDLTFGTTYRVVHAYNFDTGLAELWVNPVNEASTSVSHAGIAGTAVERYAYRQAGPSSGTSSQTVDNLCVAFNFNDALNCTPEPATAAFFGLGLVALLRRRR